MTDMTEPTDGLDSKAGVAVLIAANSVAVTSGPLMPLIIGALVANAGFAPVEAGLILSAQFAAIAISSLTVATRVDRWNRRLLCVAGIGLIFVGNGLSMIADSFTVFLAVRFLTGLGEGTAIATVNGTAAGARDPQKLFALLGLSIGFYSAAILFSGGFLIENFGTNGIFGMAALVALVVSPAVIWFPANMGGEAVQERPADRGGAIGKIGILGLLGYAVFAFGHSATWAYIQPIAESIGLSIAFVGTVLAAGAVVAPAGPGLAHVIGTRFGNTLPTAAGLVTIGLFILLLGQGGGTISFATALVAVSIIMLFLMPYLMGALSVLDPSGRLPAAAPAFMTAGVVVGPATGGVVIEYGFSTLTWMSFGIILIGGALICVVTRLADQRSADVPQEAGAPAAE